MLTLLKNFTLIVIAFAGGWLAHAWLRPVPNSGLPPVTQVVVQKDNYIPVFSSESDAQSVADIATYPSDPPTPDPTANPRLDSFRVLIESNKYQKAVNFYIANESTVSSGELERWRAVVHEHLELKLANSELQLFQDLAENWLNYRYNDIDTLLLMAQYHWAMGYINEALHTYIQAESYANSSYQRSQVKEQMYKFIVRYDADLAAAEEWYELSNFYEQLDQLDVASAGDKYRYAELLLTQGDERSAFQLLDEISNNPTWRKKALDLKQLWSDNGRYQASAKPGFAASVPLKPIGNHYLVQLRLNDGEPLKLMLDTGASITMINDRAFGRQISADGWSDLGWRYFNTANGVARGRLMEVERANLGEFAIAKLNIAVQGVDFGDDIDGLLGMNVLSRFHFQIDQDRHELLLTPRG
ncbi:aspartyl protease [Alteromonadaceae bacterium 2753L.S.0a.02]|nr:aspartyl protease [Alteromonadaceae bacterium 2753L.S.0a.02]